MRDANQKMRFNDAELSLLKGLFADNEELLFSVRKVMLQFELTKQEEITLKKNINETTFALLKKVFLPELEGDAPIFQLTDMILGLGSDIKDKPIELAMPYIQAKDIEIKYLAQRLEALRGNDIPEMAEISLADMAKIKLTKTNAESVYANILARNFILSFVDTHIQQMKFLAGLKEETVEQTKDRLQKDSNK